MDDPAAAAGGGLWHPPRPTPHVDNDIPNPDHATPEPSEGHADPATGPAWPRPAVAQQPLPGFHKLPDAPPRPAATATAAPKAARPEDPSASLIEPDTCRICRGEATPQEPLFYPCKCSGSIKFVHQDCLMEWLSHSQKQYCELCKTPYRFTKLYASSMPRRVPALIFARHLAAYFARTVLGWCRILLVAAVWLVMLPYLTRWEWSISFWMSEEGLVSPTFVGGLAAPILNSASQRLQQQQQQQRGEAAAAAASAATTAGLLSSTLDSNETAATTYFGKLLGSVMGAVSVPDMVAQLATSANGSTGANGSLASDASSPSSSFFFSSAAPAQQNAVATAPPTLLSDVAFLRTLTRYPFFNRCVIYALEGQLITVLVIVCFILVILVRDYVVQQQPADLNLRPGFEADAVGGGPDQGQDEEEVLVVDENELAPDEDDGFEDVDEDEEGEPYDSMDDTDYSDWDDYGSDYSDDWTDDSGDRRYGDYRISRRRMRELRVPLPRASQDDDDPDWETDSDASAGRRRNRTGRHRRRAPKARDETSGTAAGRATAGSAGAAGGAAPSTAAPVPQRPLPDPAAMFPPVPDNLVVPEELRRFLARRPVDEGTDGAEGTSVQEFLRIYRQASGQPDQILRIAREENLVDRLEYWLRLTQQIVDKRQHSGQAGQSGQAGPAGPAGPADPTGPAADPNAADRKGKGRAEGPAAAETPTPNDASSAAAPNGVDAFEFGLRPRAHTDGPARAPGPSPFASNNWTFEGPPGQPLEATAGAAGPVREDGRGEPSQVNNNNRVAETAAAGDHAPANAPADDHARNNNANANNDQNEQAGQAAQAAQAGAAGAAGSNFLGKITDFMWRDLENIDPADLPMGPLLAFDDDDGEDDGDLDLDDDEDGDGMGLGGDGRGAGPAALGQNGGAAAVGLGGGFLPDADANNGGGGGGGGGLLDIQDGAAAAAAAAAAAMDADAIEDAEDFEGVMELLGVRGPLVALFQNVVFCATLVTVTLLVGVVLPYNVGRISALVAVHPMQPLMLLIMLFKVIQDCTALVLGGGLLVVLHAVRVAGLAACWVLGAGSGGLLEAVRAEAVAAGFARLLAWCTASTTRVFQSALFEGPLLSRTDIRVFSDASHEALLLLKQGFGEAVVTAGQTLVSLAKGDVAGNAARLRVAAAAAGRVGSAAWALALRLPALLAHPGSWVITLDGGGSTLLASNGTAAATGAGAGAGAAAAAASAASAASAAGAAAASAAGHAAATTWESGDRFLAIVLGYATLFLVAGLYLQRGVPFSGTRAVQEVELTVLDGLAQASGVLKVILIIGIEMLVFPLYCGVLLDVALLPLFEDTTLGSRLRFTGQYPLTSVFVHWFVGTGYMFHFALFVSMCRKIMRRGVLYFIRDPDDPEFHPVRDVLERSVTTQLRKILFSAFVYGALVMVCLGGVVWGLAWALPGVLPVHHASNEPVLEFPIDLLFYNFLMPMAIRVLRPSDGLHAMYTWWFRKSARLLRLTWFLFGERRIDEEGVLRLADDSPYRRYPWVARLVLRLEATGEVVPQSLRGLWRGSGGAVAATADGRYGGQYAQYGRDGVPDEGGARPLPHNHHHHQHDAADERLGRARRRLLEGPSRRELSRQSVRKRILVLTEQLEPDGRFVRVPASDQVKIPKGQRVFMDVPAAELRRILAEGADDRELDFDRERWVRVAALRHDYERYYDDHDHHHHDHHDHDHDHDHHHHDDHHPNNSLYTSHQYQMVYIPPHFRVRVFLFIALIWLFAAVTGVSVTVIPLLFGRWLFRALLPAHIRTNDIYAFSMGIYVMGLAVYGAFRARALALRLVVGPARKWLRRRQRRLRRRQQQQHVAGGEERATAAAPTTAWKTWTRRLLFRAALALYRGAKSGRRAAATAARLAYTYLFVLVVFPLLNMALLELYVLLPLHTFMYSPVKAGGPDGAVPVQHTVRVMQSWTVGLLTLRVAVRLVTSWYPDTRLSAAIRAVMRRGRLDPDVRLLTRALVVPGVVLGAAAAVLPVLLADVYVAWTGTAAAAAAGQPGQAALVHRYSYPVVALALAAAWMVRGMVGVVRTWHVRIRDEAYLIGERLHNFGGR